MHERPLVQPGVGHDEVGLVDLGVVDEEDVDVERAGAPPLAGHPPRLLLQTLGDLEQLARGAIRVDGDDGVQVVGLLGPADRCRLVDGRHGHDPDPVGGGEPVDGGLQGAGPVADVGTEAEVRPPRRWTAAGADRVRAEERVGVEAGEVVVDAKAQVLGGFDVGPDRDGAHDRSLLAVTDPHDHRAAVVVPARAAALLERLDRDDEPVGSPHGYRSMRTAT